jgi:hypothetical protein
VLHNFVAGTGKLRALVIGLSKSKDLGRRRRRR